MRLWSLHPCYLDSKGLVALWREGLLAQKVLAGNTKGYRKHPQLLRFQEQEEPLAAIGRYLRFVYEEAAARQYAFNATKILFFETEIHLSVNDAQLVYEWEHLQRKLKTRDFSKYEQNHMIQCPLTHPLFYKISGEIEPWEVIAS